MNSNDTPKIKVAIVDDEELIVTLMTEFFMKHPRLEVVMSANNGADIIEKLRNSDVCPDVLSMDMQMPVMDGIEASKIIRREFPSIKIVIITSFYKKIFIGHMLRLGLNAFIPKGITPNALSECVIEVYDKGFFFMPEQIDVMRQQISESTPEPQLQEEEGFSPREIEILKLTCQQYTSEEIANKMNIAKRTIEGYRSNLMLRIGAKNIIGLVLYCIQNGIVDVDECMLSNKLTFLPYKSNK